MFKALVLENKPEFRACVSEVDDGFLPDGDVTLDIEYSTLNYKDALAITNSSPVVRQWPMIAGIDGAGTVAESTHPKWKRGDAVILNGFGVGETHKGCLAQRARLKGDWLVRLPAGLRSRDAMAIGTAGYTAMLCVLALERHGVRAGDGEVLVTGATGGVGAYAVLILAKLGYRVVGATGKADQEEFLKTLGASGIIGRSELSSPGKPLQKERWAGVVDAVGSQTLANACAQTRYGGAVAACGLAGGIDLPATVMPFILRSVALLGVDSVQAPMSLREEAWSRLAQIVTSEKLDLIANEVTLAEAIDAAPRLLRGEVKGRIVVRPQ